MPISVRQPSHQHDGAVALTGESIQPCFWRVPTGAWKQRINVDDLSVGQKLTGILVQELPDAKTGPKVWFDCGVGRIEAGSWKIVTGMHRIRERKESVLVKKVARLRKKRDGVDLWVSRIYPANRMFEVVTREEDVPTTRPVVISASSLQPKQEMIGKVVRIEPYGVFVDVGANRDGLLHIQKVADLFGSYIDKEGGLIEAGLEKGAKIRVVVANNEAKRLFLDFPDDVKADAEKERAEREQGKLERRKISEPDKASLSGVLSEEEAAAWIAFATGDSQSIASISSSAGDGVSAEEAAAWALRAGDNDVEEDDDDDDDDYYDDDDDEDRNIEDALGIGMY